MRLEDISGGLIEILNLIIIILKMFFQIEGCRIGRCPRLSNISKYGLGFSALFSAHMACTNTIDI